MSLLSSAQKANIRSKIKEVTDTFFVTDLIYHFGYESLDRFQEDRGDMAYYSLPIQGFAENGSNENEIIERLQGIEDLHRMIFSFNITDLKALNLIDLDIKWVGNIDRDYITHKGDLYRIKDVKYDGPLDEEEILLVIEADKDLNSKIINDTVIANGNELPWVS